MKKIKYIIFALLLILININFSFAQTDTDEVAVKEMYKDFFTLGCYIVNGPEPGACDEYDNKMLKLIDVAIQILKTSPNSLEAYNALLFFPNSFEVFTDVVVNKYKELKAQCYEGLNDPDTNTAEKLFFMHLTNIYHGSLEPGEKHSELFNKCMDGLKKMKNECKNKDYQALATGALFNEGKIEDCRIEFLKKFPDHLAIPYVKLHIIGDYYINENYEKCIEELNLLLNQYKDTTTPEGWKFEVCCYELFAGCYARLRDFPTAQKYLTLIEEKSPNNPEIKTIRNIIESVQSQPTDVFPSKDIKNK